MGGRGETGRGGAAVRAVLGLLVAGSFCGAQDFDLLIRGGRIVDGTGNPSYLGDVGIRGGKIAAMGRLAGKTARRTIDATGLTVAPGFIDVHNHSDYTILTDGNAESMVRQGVTTMIVGEGGSAAPIGGRQEPPEVPADWTTFSGYFARLLRQGVSTNIGSLVGSSQVWTYVRGPRAGPPSPEELDQMRALVRQAMEQGALGVASSLSGPPGSWIDAGTLVAMCEVASQYGGIYSTHVRTEGHGVFEAVAEAIGIGRRAQIPVDILHLKIAEHKLWGRMPELVAVIAQARASGQQVEANVYPYRAGQNNLASIIPPWAHEGGTEAMLRRLRDPALRARLEAEILHGMPGANWYNHYTATGGWEGMLLVSLSNPNYKRFEGKRMSEVIQALGRKPLEALFELLEANGGSVPTVYFHHSEEDMRCALRQPFVSIGSDGAAVAAEGPLARGNPHPRYYGTFPRVLGRYVREEKVLSLEEAVRKMTSANAAKIRIYDRGLLRPGQWADITVFDAARVIDHATYEKPHQYATGVEYVFVNGVPVLEKGRHTGARPGVIIYGPGLAARAPEESELHQAVKAGDLARVKALLDGGADVNARDPLGGTPLHDAAWSGRADVVELLLARGADVNARHAEAGSTPLHYAVITNHLEIVRLLLDKGADVHARYRSGATALHLAANRGYKEIVELLLARGASFQVRDETDASPLDEACWKGQVEVVKLLLARGASFRQRNRQTGATPLHEAAIKGHREVVEVLLAAGADANAKDKSGATPLDEALRYRHGAVVEVLLKKGAMLQGGPSAGGQRLQEAVLRGQLEVVRLILDSGADPALRTPQGSTLLHDAALKGYKEIVELLLDRGAPVDARNASGATPLHDAALGGNTAVIELLLGRGAPIDARDQEAAATPLHYAASWGRREAVALLLEKGADANARNKSGLTPLAAALENGHNEIAELIRARGGKQ